MKDLFIYELIDNHLLYDKKPSVFLSNLFEKGDLNDYPFTMLSDLASIPQNKKYHPEGDVWKHVLMVVDAAAEKRGKSKDPRVFMWSALLHDIGKGPATKIKKGRIVSYDHEKIGKDMAVKFLKEFEDDDDFISEVSNMVRWHMEALFFNKNLPFSNVERMLSEVSLNEISLLNLSDRLGRGEMTHERAQEEIKGVNSFIEGCRKIEKQQKSHIYS